MNSETSKLDVYKLLMKNYYVDHGKLYKKMASNIVDGIESFLIKRKSDSKVICTIVHDSTDHSKIIGLEAEHDDVISYKLDEIDVPRYEEFNHVVYKKIVENEIKERLIDYESTVYVSVSLISNNLVNIKTLIVPPDHGNEISYKVNTKVIFRFEDEDKAEGEINESE